MWASLCDTELRVGLEHTVVWSSRETAWKVKGARVVPRSPLQGRMKLQYRQDYYICSHSVVNRPCAQPTITAHASLQGQETNKQNKCPTAPLREERVSMPSYRKDVSVIHSGPTVCSPGWAPERTDMAPDWRASVASVTPHRSHRTL